MYGQPQATGYSQPHGGKSTAEMEAVRAWFIAIDTDRWAPLSVYRMEFRAFCKQCGKHRQTPKLFLCTQEWGVGL
jgi:hypothetical protein